MAKGGRPNAGCECATRSRQSHLNSNRRVGGESHEEHTRATSTIRLTSATKLRSLSPSLCLALSLRRPSAFRLLAIHVPASCRLPPLSARETAPPSHSESPKRRSGTPGRGRHAAPTKTTSRARSGGCTLSCVVTPASQRTLTLVLRCARSTKRASVQARGQAPKSRMRRPEAVPTSESA